MRHTPINAPRANPAQRAALAAAADTMLAKGAGAKQIASLYAGLTTVPTLADVDLAWAAVDVTAVKSQLPTISGLELSSTTYLHHFER